HARRADMKKNIARRRDRMMDPMDLTEGVQILWLRRTEKPVPGVGAEGHDAGQPPFEVAEADRAQKRRQIAAQRPYRGFIFLAGIDRHDEKNRGSRELSDNGL